MSAATYLFHDRTDAAIASFVAHPGHALLLTAPTGSGKATAATLISSRLLRIPFDRVLAHPQIKIVRSELGKAISVEVIRDAIHFTALRSTEKGSTTRIIIIEDGQLMTMQAQNALLKTIEEPPAGTVIIITAIDEQSVLSTIRSRAQHITLTAPQPNDIQAYFQQAGYEASVIDRALRISGGLPGLMQALLEADSSHPLYTATATAREILQKTLFERLVMAETLSKQRQLWIDTLFILSQMAHMAIQQNVSSQTDRWRKVLEASYNARVHTARNGQLKLVLLHFMLAI